MVQGKSVKKYLFILIILGLAMPMISLAGKMDLNGPIVPCGRCCQEYDKNNTNICITPCPGVTPPESANRCTLCDLFVLVQRIIDYIIAALMVFAPIFIILGGIMILISGTKPDQVSLGKKMITNAIIGVIISLLAWTLVNMVFNQLVSKDTEKFPWPWNEIKCEGGGITPGQEENRNICTCGENKMIGSKEYPSGKECLSQCSNYCKQNFSGYIGGDYGCCETKIMQNGCFASSPSGEWCQRPAPSGSDIWILSGIKSEQKGDANASLVNFINCMYAEVMRVYGSTNNLTITSISDDKLCDGTCDPATGVGCSHTKNSCHYGGTNCTGGSSAVDFRANATTCAWLAQTAQYCGGSNAYWINFEGNHLHISLNKGTCGCNEGTTPTPCP